MNGKKRRTARGAVFSGMEDLSDIPSPMRKEWQSIVDLIARIARVRAALIMQVRHDEIGVFVASRTEGNPYRRGHKNRLTDSGLYCERVIKTARMLEVPDAGKSEEWRRNPDMKYGMRCYLGFPVRLPNGRPFGTICMLDDKENHFSQDMKDFMEKMRDLIESYLKLLLLSVADGLTGIYNRNYLNIAAEREVRAARRSRRPMSLLLMDVDGFKGINDTFGHLAGDRVLRNFARAMVASLKGGGIPFRFGGDEFVVLLPDTVLEDATARAERLRASVERKKILPGTGVTVSIGAAQWDPGESLDRWLMRADRALYRVKNGGRNGVGT